MYKFIEHEDETISDLSRELGHNVYILASRLSQDNPALEKALKEETDISLDYYRTHTGLEFILLFLFSISFGLIN